jgi:hypothetical protein
MSFDRSYESEKEVVMKVCLFARNENWSSHESTGMDMCRKRRPQEQERLLDEQMLLERLCLENAVHAIAEKN